MTDASPRAGGAAAASGKLELFPAIDLRAGRCVRLHQGDFAAETVYDDDPVRVARAFEDAGARWIHVVDLDAARTGADTNLDVIAAICASVGCRVQAGGGVRNVEAARRRIDAGVTRVVVGTAAIESPEVLEELGTQFPRQVAVGLDARGREIATRGWERDTGVDLVDYARVVDPEAIAALIVTSIARDATMAGPDLEQLGDVLEATAVPVIASGGVGTLGDVHALAAVQRGGRRLAGVIVGKAIYEHRFTVADALGALGST